jgi:hypothetical protein
LVNQKEGQMAQSKRKGRRAEVRVRGFARPLVVEGLDHSKIGRYRIQLGEKGRVVGDSGWVDNTITNDGRNSYIAAKVGSVTGSKTPTHLQIATQSTAVDATQTSLVGETRIRKSLDASTLATGTLRMTASWSSTDNTAACTIGSIGVYNTDSGGTLGSGQTYTTSNCGALAA